MPDIRINQLPLATGPTAPTSTDTVAIDGLTTRKSTLSGIADAIRPLASQAEAEAGSNAVKGMSPLTTAQAIEAQALVPSSIGASVQAYSDNLNTLAGITSGATGREILADSTVDDVYTSLTTAVWTSGTTRTMKQRATDTYCILDAPGSPDPTGVNTSTASLQAMATEANANKGLKLDLMYGNFRITEGLYFNRPVDIIGRGRGYWHPKPPTAGDGLSTEAPLQIILTGTATKNRTAHGMSSMRPSGGVITNPSASNGNDTEYSLTSFVNPVSDGSLPRSLRSFSAGLWFAPGAAGSRVSGIRVIPDGGGANGLSKYTVAGSASDAWADNWDVGVVNEMANQMLFKDCEFVGHYRMVGELILAIPADPSNSAIPALWGVAHENVQTSGWRATEIRGADAFRCIAVGADYIEVPWSDDHPFDPSVFNYIGYGTGTFSLVGSTTFSGLTRIGSTLRLTGVSGAGSITVGNHIYSRRFGGGTSHVTWDENCKFTGMNHQSGEVCHSAALGVNAMPNPGATFVASGWRMTELENLGSIQTIEEVGIHVHSLAGSNILPNLEGSGPKPWRTITSPNETDNTRVANPAGRTQSSYIDSRRGLVNESGIDARPVLASAAAAASYPSDNGFFSFASTCEIPSMDFRKTDGVKGFYFDRSVGRSVQGAHTYPLVDNTYDDGSSAFRKRSDFARNQFFGTGRSAVTGGAGSPVGAVGGNAGTVWIDESTGKPYAKRSDAGNTDWSEVAFSLRGAATYDPPSIAAGATVTQNVTVTGAVTADLDVLVNFSVAHPGIYLWGRVSASNQVTCYITNTTAAAIDLASGTLSATVFKL